MPGYRLRMTGQGGTALTASLGASATLTGFDAYGEHYALNTPLREERGSPGVFGFNTSLLAHYYCHLECTGYAPMDVDFGASQDASPAVVDYPMTLMGVPVPPPAPYVGSLTAEIANPAAGYVELTRAPEGTVGPSQEPDAARLVWRFTQVVNLGVRAVPASGFTQGVQTMDGVRVWGGEHWFNTGHEHLYRVEFVEGAAPPPPPPPPPEPEPEPEPDTFIESYRGYDIYWGADMGYKVFLSGAFKASMISLAAARAWVDGQLGPGPEPEPGPVPGPPAGAGFVERVNWAMQAYGLGFAVAVLFALGLYELVNKK